MNEGRKLEVTKKHTNYLKEKKSECKYDQSDNNLNIKTVSEKYSKQTQQKML